MSENVEIPKQYNPHTAEEKWYRFWQDNKLFAANKDAKGEPYSIVIPPPNVTGVLHMGHALNNTIQDILIRFKKMQGFNTVWIPGTDHAGIATQNVVEKKLAKDKLTKNDLGREKFLEEVWAWKEEYGSTIIKQLKKLGSACDWDRERFTMDEGLSKAVGEVFIRLYQKGLIYKGNYIINWCSRCHTALSDEEAEHHDIKGKLYYIKYPIEDTDEYLTVATTRPETMFGDVAVAINPKDLRFKRFLGQNIILPIIKRKMKLIEDDFVESSFGTGCVKVTPAHDPNDFEMGKRHVLEPINVMDEAGIMNKEAGPYAGMDRFACRKKLVADLEDLGLLEKVEDHPMAIKHCYRCETIVEPRLSPQWFVKMKPLAEPAIAAVKSKQIKFVPAKWEKVYLEWMENIKDWCISRQIWWGHRIPIWYCKECDNIMVSVSTLTECDKCGCAKVRQEEDVLDTWFSSWLWPFSTFGWPEKNADLKCYYPTSTLVTAQEIIFFWVARMVMAGIEFMGEIPFEHVYIHGTVRDDSGKKMSKSLGNIINPLDIIQDFGADALRYSIISITACGQDVYLSPSKFEIGRNFANKIWNASRFLLMNLAEIDAVLVEKIKEGHLEIDLSPDDGYILEKLNETIEKVTSAFNVFRFNDAASSVYDFFWHDYCDKYIEAVKGVLQKGEESEKEHVCAVLYVVLDKCLKLLHPIMPFITEEIWQMLTLRLKNKSKELSIMVSPWPKKINVGISEEIMILTESKYELIKMGRNLRSEYNIAPGKELHYLIKPDSDKTAAFFSQEKEKMMKLLKAFQLEIKNKVETNQAMASAVSAKATIYLMLGEAIDLNKEKERILKNLDSLSKDLEKIKRKLANQDFIGNAPQEVIEKERAKKAELSEKKIKLEENLKIFA